MVTSDEKYLVEIKRHWETLSATVRRAARISRFRVSEEPRRQYQASQYVHGSREVLVVPGLGSRALRRAVFHETSHALDDNYGVGHYFGESPEWATLSRRHFGGEAPTVETFADAMTAYLESPGTVRRVFPQAVVTFVEKAIQYLAVTPTT